jgi:hypothetical protein
VAPSDDQAESGNGVARKQFIPNSAAIHPSSEIPTTFKSPESPMGGYCCDGFAFLIYFGQFFTGIRAEYTVLTKIGVNQFGNIVLMSVDE